MREKQVLQRAFMFFLTLIALFVLLRNGVWTTDRLLDTADRIFGEPGERLASKMIEAVRGTVNGTVVVAIAEGRAVLREARLHSFLVRGMNSGLRRH